MKMGNKSRSIITVVGKDQVGIIARVCVLLADNNVNILDISQTIVDGYFNMMMIADTENMKVEFKALSEALEALGSEISVIIKLQREDIFNSMQRI